MAEEKQKIGSARLQAFILIDKLLAKPSNLRLLKAAFQDSFEEDPVVFYKLFIKPTAEKEVVIQPGVGETPKGLKIVFCDEDKKEN